MAHKYLIKNDQPESDAVRDITTLIISYLFPGHQSLKKWKGDNKTYTFSYQPEGKERVSSAPMNYRIISRFIREHGYFDPEHFKIPFRLFECFWLDFSIDFKHNFHKFDATATKGMFIEDGTPQQQYGDSYPIRPKLSREGHSFTSLQPQLLNRIILLRNKLVETSEHALEDSWFFDLRSLICETVSVVEITLNQIYIKAEYNPNSTWVFEKSVLGERHGRRFSDKLKWVRQITGNDLNVELHLTGVDKLRELRNHMMHFDPPSLIITIEEAVQWMNLIYDVGYLLIKIRQSLGEKVSINLMNFILQPKIVFNPEPHFSARLPMSDDEGYSSSNWPAKKNHD